MRQRAVIRIALLALALFSLANSPAALAQAGSTGGTIGKTDKSISDDANEPKRTRTNVKAHSAGSAQVRVNKFIGCYRDDESRDLNGEKTGGADMSAARCIEICGSLGFTYAGTQIGYQCFCGNHYGGKGKADNCNVPCAGKHDEKCGGWWANSVYRAK
jgi:hypothetical protein